MIKTSKIIIIYKLSNFFFFDDMESSKRCVKLFSLVFIIKSISDLKTLNTDLPKKLWFPIFFWIWQIFCDCPLLASVEMTWKSNHLHEITKTAIFAQLLYAQLKLLLSQVNYVLPFPLFYRVYTIIMTPLVFQCIFLVTFLATIINLVDCGVTSQEISGIWYHIFSLIPGVV